MRFGRFALSAKVGGGYWGFVKSRAPMSFDQEIVSMYENGFVQRINTSPRIRLKAPLQRLPAVTQQGPKRNARSVPPIIEAVYLIRDAIPVVPHDDAVLPTQNGSPRRPGTMSAPLLPTLKGRSPHRDNARPRPSTPKDSSSNPAASDAAASSASLGFSFGKAARSHAKASMASVRLAAKEGAQNSSPTRKRFGQQRVRNVSEEAQLFINDLKRKLREDKLKMSDLMGQLDKDGDGQLDRQELRRGLLALFKATPARQAKPNDAAGLTEASPDGGVSEEVLEQVLDAFDADGSGSVDAHELARTLWASHKHLHGEMRAGGAGRFHVHSANKNTLRESIEELCTIGKKLIVTQKKDNDGPEEMRMKLREALRGEMSKHFMAVLGQFSGEERMSKSQFCSGVAHLFGMRPADVGIRAADALRQCAASLFDEWDMAKIDEVGCTDLMKILRKGGRIIVPKRARADAIFQAEISAYIPQARRQKATAISLAKQALHGFVIKSREEQLQNRAELVAPVQLEALLRRMANDSGTLLDLFMRWDADGDGTVCKDEFAAAVNHMGFKFSKEICDQLFSFFDKDDSDAVTLEEIEATLEWGRDRKNVRPLLAGWRQLTLDFGDGETSIFEQIRNNLAAQGKHPIDLFKDFDADGGGTLDREELGYLIHTLGGMRPSPDELGKLFDSFEHDESGNVSFKDLTAKLRAELPIERLMAVLASEDMTEAINEMFSERWDQDGDGFIEKAEFGPAMKSIGIELENETDLDDLFSLLDEDGSGSISLKELQHSLRWIRSCDKCQQLRTEAYTFDGTLSIQQQIKRALAANSVRVLVRAFQQQHE